MSFFGALLEGISFQAKLFTWAWKARTNYRKQLSLEGTPIGIAYASSFILLYWTVIPFVYAILITAGAWIIPLITSWIPHNPHGKDEVYQTKAFRGVALKVIAFEHLYHLEHHLYPAVPHHNWPELARRLDPYLDEMGIVPAKLWF